MILKQVTGNVRMLVVNPTEEVERREGGGEAPAAATPAKADTLKPEAGKEGIIGKAAIENISRRFC